MAIAGVTTTAASAAQSPDSVAWQRFWPAAAGDEWTYGYVRQVCPGWGNPCGPYVETYPRWVVIGDTLIDGVLRPVFEGPDGVCAVGPRPGDRYQIEGTGCHPAALFGAPIYTIPYDPASYPIGGTTYLLDAVLRYGSGGTFQYDYGADVGLLMLVRFMSGHGGYSVYDSFTLAHATVARVTYGQPVANEHGPADGTLQLLIGPNPARSSATIEIFGPAASAPVTLEIFDSVGRRVHMTDHGSRGAGTVRVSVDMANWHPGAYFVRATAGGLRAAVILVRAD